MFGSDPVTEIVREYGAMEAVGGAVTNYPTMSSRYGDFAREGQQQQQQQQTSAGISQRRDTHGPECFSFFARSIWSDSFVHHRSIF
jgi:hypothetical protein